MRFLLSLMGILLLGCQTVPVNVGNPTIPGIGDPIVE